MTFTVVNIIVAFGVGFLLGTVCGIGIYKIKQGPQPRVARQKKPQISAKNRNVVTSSSKVQTLDIPRITPKGKEETTSKSDPTVPPAKSIDILAPAYISSDRDAPEPSLEDDSSHIHPDDATILMQNRPPK